MGQNESRPTATSAVSVAPVTTTPRFLAVVHHPPTNVSCVRIYCKISVNSIFILFYFIRKGGQEMGSIPENGGGGSPLVPKNRSRRSSDIGDLLRHGIVSHSTLHTKRLTNRRKCILKSTELTFNMVMCTVFLVRL